MKHRLLYFTVLVSTVFILLVSSCDQNLVFEENTRIEKDSWPQDEIYSFSFQIEDTLTPTNFYVNIRNTTNYKYRNVYFFVNTLFPNGHVYRDTIECYLADKEGRWLGKGMGKIKDNSILVRENVRFPVSGQYVMEFEQAMREEELKGISDVGIRIEKNL